MNNNQENDPSLAERQRRESELHEAADRREAERCKREQMFREQRECTERKRNRAKAYAEERKKAKEERKQKKQQQGQKEQKEQKGHQEQRSGDSTRRGRGFWERSGANGSGEKKQRPKREGKPDERTLPTSTEGMAAYKHKWDRWVLSLPSQDAMQRCPMPHPILLKMYLRKQAKGSDTEVRENYRQLMRQWHPDKVNQALSASLSQNQKAELAIKVTEVAKQVNDAFSK